MTLSQDTILENRYRIEQMLGQGGMGAIYRGYDLKLDIPVALKENFFQTEQSIRQFQQEARILARLHHPNLPRVIDHFSFEAQQYLVMDFVQGQDLWEMVKESKQPLEEKQALNYLIQICQAVSYLHQQNPPIIHRDIKPQNIKITPQGRAVLVDFGIAKIAEDDSRTSTGARGVTPGFSPPEQYSGAGTTPASDIYALGATLYAVLTGKKPPDSISLLTGRASFELPQTINAKLSHRVSRAIQHALHTQQEDRPESVTSWKGELTAILESDPDQNEATIIATAPLRRFLIGPAGQSYKLKPGSLTLGRAKSCDIQVNDSAASRRHATLEFNGQQCMVYDEDSANGTFINDQPVEAGGKRLNLGDRLCIGQTVFSLSATAPTSSSLSEGATRHTVDRDADTAHLAAAEPSRVARPTSSRSLVRSVIWLALVGIVAALAYLNWADNLFFVSSSVESPVIASPGRATSTELPAIQPTDAQSPTPQQTIEITDTLPAPTSSPQPVQPTNTPPPTNTPTPSGPQIPAGKGALVMRNCLGDVVNVNIIPVGIFQELAPKTGNDCPVSDPIYLDPGEYTLKAAFANRASEGQATVVIEAGGTLNFDWR